MIIQKINESYTGFVPETSYDIETIRGIHDFLKAEKPDAKYNFKVQRGWESPYRYFSNILLEQKTVKALRVNNGHLEIIKKFGVTDDQISDIFGKSEFTEEFIDSELEEIKKIIPYNFHDFQEKCIKDSLFRPKQISLAATSAGKSLIIFGIMYFLYRNNKKGYIVVPNINLLTQLLGDFKDYFKEECSDLRDEFLSNIEIQGGGNQSSFDSFLTISTWQSLMNKREVLDRAEFILCDELHKYKSDVTSEIIKETVNAKYKWGLTGTMPEDEGDQLELIGMFGYPRRYIRAKELIERGLATPVKINSLFLNYNDTDKSIFNNIPRGNWQKQLGFIKEHERRNNFIENLAIKVKETGNTLVLGTHTEHIKTLFTNIMKKMHPTVEVQNKDITGKKSFEFQLRYGVYFLNGEDDALTRELTRKILEVKHYIVKTSAEFEVFSENDFILIKDNVITKCKKDNISETQFKDILNDDYSILEYNNKKIESIILRNEILVSNYQLLSTGISIKRLFNAILASPLKAYTTITQTIGRGLRLHPDKSLFNLYDIIDNFAVKQPSGVFVNQYKERCRHSYNTEEFPITEAFIPLVG